MNAPSATELQAKLSEYDFIVCIDKSGSMSEPDGVGGKSRWLSMQETAVQLCRDLGTLDSDGIDVVLFGGGVKTYTGVTVDTIKELFVDNRPSGSTPLAEALTESLKLAGKSNKKDFVLIFTDGVPDDPDKVAQVIRQQSNKQLNDEDCTFLFVQVGHDRAATAYLTELDDNLKGAKFDIVDAMTIEEAEKFPSTVELIYKAIND
jgi:uncharacterized protein YegL